MNFSQTLFFGIAALSGCLAGCATTQAALDQANNGTALMMSLQAEVQKFRSVQSDVARARVESIRRQQVVLATYESASGFDDRVLRLAGKTDEFSLYSTLKDLADSRIKDEQALKARLEELDESFSKLLTPLPDLTEKLAAAQKALAVLGDELSAKERIELAATFASAIKKTIDDNKKKINDAATDTPGAPVQSAADVTKK
jgi:chromosome segregation ATPase